MVLDILDYHRRWEGRQKMLSTGAAKGAARPRAIAILVFLTREGYAGFEFPLFRALPSSFIN